MWLRQADTHADQECSLVDAVLRSSPAEHVSVLTGERAQPCSLRCICGSTLDAQEHAGVLTLPSACGPQSRPASQATATTTLRCIRQGARYDALVSDPTCCLMRAFMECTAMSMRPSSSASSISFVKSPLPPMSASGCPSTCGGGAAGTRALRPVSDTTAGDYTRIHGPHRLSLRPPDGLSVGARAFTANKAQCRGVRTSHLVAGGFDDGDVQGALLLEVREGVLQRDDSVSHASQLKCQLLQQEANREQRTSLAAPKYVAGCAWYAISVAVFRYMQSTAPLPRHQPAAAAV
jgi:hypothetical protein